MSMKKKTKNTSAVKTKVEKIVPEVKKENSRESCSGSKKSS